MAYNLYSARKANEFYIQLTSIGQELCHYRVYFHDNVGL